jgi:hypothetical protein
MASLLHSLNNPTSLTSRLGATINVGQNHVRFPGGPHPQLFGTAAAKTRSWTHTCHPTLEDLPAHGRADLRY